MNDAITITPESTPTRIGVAFCQILRGLGLKVPVSRVTFFLEALGKVGLEDRDAVYWAGRSTLVADPEEIGDFDRAFEVFWEQRRSSNIEVQLPPVAVAVATDESEDSAERISGLNQPAL